MGKIHKDCVKGFHWYSRAWYSKGQLPEGRVQDRLNIGFFHKEGGTTGEFMIEWEDVGPYVAPRLKACDDGWHALASMPELIQLMASWDDENRPIEQFAEAMLNLGFKDLTERRAPAPFPFTLEDA